MPSIKIIKSKYDNSLSKGYVKIPDFKSKDRAVDEKGRRVEANFQGRSYKILYKFEKNYSCAQLFGRRLLAVLAIICTLGKLRHSKSIIKLWEKDKETIRLAAPIKKTETVVKNGLTYYEEPNFLFHELEIDPSTKLNFGLVLAVDGKEKLLPMISEGDKWKAYAGNPMEAILLFSKDEQSRSFYHNLYYPSVMNFMLRNPDICGVDAQALVHYLLENDEKQTPRLFSLKAPSILALLEFMEDKKIPIDFNKKSPSGETLFTKWVALGNQEITSFILDKEISVLKQIEGLNPSLFILNASLGNPTAVILSDGMKKFKIALSDEEIWYKRAVQGDCNFTPEDFNKLSDELKERLYYVSNTFFHLKLVQKLNDLGMQPKPLFRTEHSTFVTENMDIVTAKGQISQFLKNLRGQGALLLEKDFKDEKRYNTEFAKGIVQGKEMIERIIQEKNLKHIKLPKILIVSSNQETIEVGYDFRPNKAVLDFINLKNESTCIYVEIIESQPRTLTLEEAFELLTVLEIIGYRPLLSSVVITDKGIYLTDPDFSMFDPDRPDFDAISLLILSNILDSKNQNEFLKELETRKEAYKKKKEILRARTEEYENFFKNNPRKRLLDGYRKIKFKFSWKTLE